MKIVVAFAGAIVLCSAAFAQEHSMAHSAPVSIEKGLGELRVPVTTRNGEAQSFFDQGMRYVYAFNHEAAVASFKRAAELDPNLAMAFWGQALALGPNINMDVDPEREAQAYELSRKAQSLREHGSQKERDLIDVLMLRYSNDPAADLKKLAADYAAGMRKVHAKYPDDPDIAALFAESLMDLHPWKLWTHDGKPAEDTNEIVSVLESTLKAHPNHVGANHYYIHAVEGSPRPDRALASAKRLTTAAPAAGHLVHMPAHVYQRTGRYIEAAEANLAGAKADREFMKRYGNENMYSMMYYNHNLDFGAASYAMAGEYEKARTFADEMSPVAAQLAKQAPPIEPFSTGTMKVLVRFAKWDDVLKVTDEPAGPWSASFRHFARALAFARTGKLDDARAEQKEFEASRAAHTDDTGFLQNSTKQLASVAAPLIEGRIAEAAGDRAAAIDAYQRAVTAEDALFYNEPADWFYPTRETLGGALLRNRDYKEAEKVFRRDLERNPNNPRSLFGLSRALRAQKKDSSAIDSAFKRAWHGDALRVEDL